MATGKEKAGLVGNDHGIEVKASRKDYTVKFDYDRELVRRMHKVEGAQRGDDGLWHVPRSSEAALEQAVKGMRAERAAIQRDLVGINDLAKASATALQAERGVGHDIAPRISDFVPHNKGIYGEVINVNPRFAAQLTGFGSEDGCAFVTLHRLADLDTQVFKGNVVKVLYDDKGRGAVTDRSQARQRDDRTSVLIDGVRVDEAGDKLLVSFEYNPALEARLRRVAGVEYAKDANAFAVPLDNKDFAMRAVHDMRGEFIADNVEREELRKVAASLVDGATIRDAFTKDGQQHFGQVVHDSDRYLMQSAGQGQFKLHRKQLLDKTVPVGQRMDVTYQKGRGAVKDKSQENAKQSALTR